jgi:hypothetical protein
MARVQEIVEPDGTVVVREPSFGNMRWDGNVWRRWNGRGWVHAAYSLHPERLKVSASFHRETPLDTASRQRALALAVEDQVTTKGATVVFSGPSGVVLSYRRRVAHLAHAVMTVITAGLWAVVWLAMALGRSEDRVRLEVDRWGNVWPRRASGA